jgi:hypothetical protein
MEFIGMFILFIMSTYILSMGLATISNSQLTHQSHIELFTYLIKKHDLYRFAPKDVIRKVFAEDRELLAQKLKLVEKIIKKEHDLLNSHLLLTRKSAENANLRMQLHSRDYARLMELKAILEHEIYMDDKSNATQDKLRNVIYIGDKQC